jgi:hypothetical protein
MRGDGLPVAKRMIRPPNAPARPVANYAYECGNNAPDIFKKRFQRDTELCDERPDCSLYVQVKPCIALKYSVTIDNQ